MKKTKENIFIRILAYTFSYPLSFLGFACWGGLMPLAFLNGLLGWNIPGWFVSFVIILGFVFLGLSQKYEPKA